MHDKTLDQDWHDLFTVLDAGYVQRYHTATHVPPQTLADHQWRVGIWITAIYGGRPDGAVLLRAFTHDCSEIAIGDIPWQAKREQGLAPIVKALEQQWEEKMKLVVQERYLSDDEKWLIKAADILDGMMHCARWEDVRWPSNRNIFENWQDTMAEHFQKVPGTVGDMNKERVHHYVRQIEKGYEWRFR